MNNMQKLEQVQKSLNVLHNDLMISLATIEGSINQDKQKELQYLLAQEQVIIKNNELNRSALTLLEFALENELYEVCPPLKKVIDILNPDAK